jgi:hypothetical protein
MADYKIEQDVPIPNVKKGISHIANLILNEMKPGDSIGNLTVEEKNKFASTAANYCVKASVRREPNMKNKWRFWKLEEQDKDKLRKKRTNKSHNYKLKDYGLSSKSDVSDKDLPQDYERSVNIDPQIIEQAKASDYNYSMHKKLLSYRERILLDQNDFKYHDTEGNPRPVSFDD